MGLNFYFLFFLLQIIENLEMKRVPNDVKYKFLDEIAESFTEEQPLFLEYKPQFLENEVNTMYICHKIKILKLKSIN